MALTVAEQTADILSQITARLSAGGSAKDQLLFVQIWLSDMADWAEMNTVWTDWIGEGPTPTRATVESGLLAPYRVEIAAIAARIPR